jgi:hypothetical protein
VPTNVASWNDADLAATYVPAWKREPKLALRENPVFATSGFIEPLRRYRSKRGAATKSSLLLEA